MAISSAKNVSLDNVFKSDETFLAIVRITDNMIKGDKNMVVILFQILLIITFGFLIYGALNYYRNPYRKLNKAKQKNEFYLVDDENNIKKNFQFVFKGCLFEGEKYIGSTDEQFVVATIHIIAHDPLELTGITKEDLKFLEEKIKLAYPHAQIKWKHPITLLFN